MNLRIPAFVTIALLAACDPQIVEETPLPSPEPIVSLVLGNRATTVSVADSTRRLLAGEGLIGQYGIGRPGLSACRFTAPDGTTIRSEITRGANGQVRRIVVFKGSEVVMASDYVLTGSGWSAAHTLGSGRLRLTASSRSPGVEGEFAAAKAPGEGADCGSATWDYYTALMAVGALVLSFPVDPTPVQLAFIAMAVSHASVMHARMVAVCQAENP